MKIRRNPAPVIGVALAMLCTASYRSVPLRDVVPETFVHEHEWYRPFKPDDAMYAIVRAPGDGFLYLDRYGFVTKAWTEHLETLRTPDTVDTRQVIRLDQSFPDKQEN